MADRPDATEWLGEIAAPSVVIVGAQDGIIPVQKSHDMETLLGRSWLVVIEEAGHMPMMEAPERMGEALRQLVKSRLRMKNKVIISEQATTLINRSFSISKNLTRFMTG